MNGGENARGENREVSAVDSDSVSKNGQSQSGETASEVKTPEAEAAAPITSGRGPPSTSRAACSKCGVPLVLSKAFRHLARVSPMLRQVQVLHTSPTFDMTLINTGEVKQLAKYILGPLRFSLRGRTRGEDRRLSTDTQYLGSLEDVLETTMAVEEEALLEEMNMADAGACIEMPTRKMQDVPPPPTTQAEVIRPPFWKAFERSQRVEINDLLDIGCFAPVDKNKVPTDRKIVASK